jgi:hypothetical protein
MGIPLTLIVTPLLYAAALAVADVINAFSRLPPAFLNAANEVGRLGFAVIGTLAGERTLYLSRWVLMNSYVERTRPALSFVDIGIRPPRLPGC